MGWEGGGWVGGWVMGQGVGKEVDKPPYRHLGVCSCVGLLPCQRDIHGTMAAVPGHSFPTGALQRCHSLNCDITRLSKCPPEKHTSIHWTVEALCMDSS